MKRAPAKKKSKRGRPKADLNTQKIRASAAEFCTIEEIAASQGVAGRTLLRRKEDPAVAQAIAEGQAIGRARLRAIMWKMAKTGNTAAAIFLAKQKSILGYSDKTDVEVGGPDGKPIQAAITVTFVKAGDVVAPVALAEPEKPSDGR